MAKIHASHTKEIGPNRIRHTLTFTRTAMREMCAEAARETARNLPSRNMQVWEGEDCVIIERNLT